MINQNQIGREEQAIVMPERWRARMLVALCSTKDTFAIIKQFMLLAKDGGYDFAERFSEDDADKLDELGKSALGYLREDYNKLNMLERQSSDSSDAFYAREAPFIVHWLKMPSDLLLIAIAGHVEAHIPDTQKETDWFNDIKTAKDELENVIRDKRSITLLLDVDETDHEGKANLEKRFAREDERAQQILIQITKSSDNKTQHIISPNTRAAQIIEPAPDPTYLERRREFEVSYKYGTVKKRPKDVVQTKQRLKVRSPKERVPPAIVLLNKIEKFVELIPEMLDVLEKERQITDYAVLQTSLSSYMGERINLNALKNGFFINKDKHLKPEAIGLLRFTAMTSIEAYSRLKFKAKSDQMEQDALPRDMRRIRAGLAP